NSAGRRAGTRTAPHHSRRAPHRPRRRFRPAGEGRAAAARGQRRYRHHDYPHPRSGRAHGGAHRRTQPRPPRRRGDAGGAAHPHRPRQYHARGDLPRPRGRRDRRRMSLAPASLPWLARHELRLAWRDWIAMATGGRHRRGVFLLLALAAFAAGLHWLANALLRPWAAAGLRADPQTLLMITSTGVLFFTAMLSQ